jgi:hypothetical protein
MLAVTSQVDGGCREGEVWEAYQDGRADVESAFDLFEAAAGDA